MLAPGGPHGDIGQQRRQQLWRFLWQNRHAQQIRPAIVQRFHALRQGAPGGATPQRIARKRLGGGADDGKQAVQRDCRLGTKAIQRSKSWRYIILPPANQGFRLGTVPVAQAGVFRAGGARAKLHAGQHPIQPGGRAQPTQHQPIQRPHAGQPGKARITRPHQRMLEQSQQRHRRKPLCHGIGKRGYQAARRQARKRHSSAIVHCDLKARKLHPHPLCQRPVGGDQRRRFARKLDSLPHGDGNRQRLFRRRCSFQKLHARKRIWIGRKALPLAGHCSGCHSAANKRGSGRQASRAGGAMRPIFHFSGCYLHGGEQAGKAILRMGFQRPGIHAQYGVPGFSGQCGVQAGKHDLSVRKPGNNRHQGRHGRRRTGKACDKDRRGRRRSAPPRCQRLQQKRAPPRSILLAARLQQRWPLIHHHIQHFQAGVPMLLQSVGEHDGFQIGSAFALDFQRVQRGGKLAREGKTGCRAIFIAVQQAHQGYLPGKRLNRRRKFGGSFQAFGKTSKRFIRIHITHRGHAGQQQGISCRQAHKGFGKCTNGAAIGQQHQCAGKRQVALPFCALQQTKRQIIGKAPLGRDGEKLWPLLRDAQAAPRFPSPPLQCQHQTTAPGAIRQTAGLARPRDPTGGSSRRALSSRHQTDFLTAFAGR